MGGWNSHPEPEPQLEPEVQQATAWQQHGNSKHAKHRLRRNLSRVTRSLLRPVPIAQIRQSHTALMYCSVYVSCQAPHLNETVSPEEILRQLIQIEKFLGCKKTWISIDEHVWLHGAVPISLASIQWTDKDVASKTFDTFERSGDQAVLSSFVGGLRFRRKQLDSLIAYGDRIFTLLISTSKHGFNIHWCLWMLRVSHFQPSPTINYIPLYCARCPLVKLVQERILNRWSFVFVRSAACNWPKEPNANMGPDEDVKGRKHHWGRNAVAFRFVIHLLL